MTGTGREMTGVGISDHEDHRTFHAKKNQAQDIYRRE